VAAIPGIGAPAAIASSAINIAHGNVGSGLWDLSMAVPFMAEAIGGIREASSVATIAEEATAGKCFVAGTMVVTSEGEIPIEQIVPGEQVLSTNTDTGETTFKRVVRTFVHQASAVLDIQIGDTVITVTETHRFWVPGVGWQEARNLAAGSPLLDNNDKILVVDATTRHEGNFTVYNFEVQQFHTYHVSRLGVLVHNDCLSIAKAVVRKSGGTIVKIVNKNGRFRIFMPEGMYSVKNAYGEPEKFAYHYVVVKAGKVMDQMSKYGKEWVDFRQWWGEFDSGVTQLSKGISK
jgi:hypothetical protein